MREQVAVARLRMTSMSVLVTLVLMLLLLLFSLNARLSALFADAPSTGQHISASERAGEIASAEPLLEVHYSIVGSSAP
ncbi:MAG: hypothetical protein H5T69_05675 [Chloroflexi bacterium]|nr:hypothetical protein [Chloroflexota bacterium]